MTQKATDSTFTNLQNNIRGHKYIQQHLAFRLIWENLGYYSQKNLPYYERQLHLEASI